jgi:hypothetical protein
MVPGVLSVTAVESVLSGGQSLRAVRREVVVQSNVKPRPGVVLLVCGVVFIALSIVRVATGWSSESRLLLPDLSGCVVGAAVGLWGWSRLRLAKRTCPDQTWWQFLRGDVITLGIGAVLMAGFLMLSPEQRDDLGQSMLKLVEWMSLVRGRP